MKQKGYTEDVSRSLDLLTPDAETSDRHPDCNLAFITLSLYQRCAEPFALPILCALDGLGRRSVDTGSPRRWRVVCGRCRGGRRGE
jgi:hypothetical protein